MNTIRFTLLTPRQAKRTGKNLPVRFVLTLPKGDSNGLGVGLQTMPYTTTKASQPNNR